MITMIYFSFTSLSTVGLGDLHPRSNVERVVGALMLLVGVALTSLIVNTLTTMLEKLRMSHFDFNDEEGLSVFFGTLHRFNKDSPVDPDFRAKIENHLRFRW